MQVRTKAERRHNGRSAWRRRPQGCRLPMPGTQHRRIEALKRLLKGRRSLLIVVQDYPDPDALASAAALREFAHRVGRLPCTVESCGVLGRSENRALLRYLGLPYHSVDEISIDSHDVIALVDTQPGTGNNGLPSNISGGIPMDRDLRIQTCTVTARASPFRPVFPKTAERQEQDDGNDQEKRFHPQAVSGSMRRLTGS